MEPGDFILWDSRAAHYGAAPLGNNKRMAICEDFLYQLQHKENANLPQTHATSPLNF